MTEYMKDRRADDTLFSFIFAGLKFRENFLGTFRESLISRSRRRIVFAGNLISRNLRLRPSSDVVLLPCRTKLQFGSTVARQEIYSDSDVVPESNQIQGLLEPRNNSPPNSPRERNLARTY